MVARQVDLSDGPTAFRIGEGKKTAPIEEAALPEQYGLLEATLAEAVDRDVISPLPPSEPGSHNEYARSRLKTIRNRIFLLGYLDRDSGRANLGEVLKEGIRAFQREAKVADDDFAIDGWVGEQTWTALQELVSFEEPSNLGRWFVDGEACDALKRAIQLRLFALGLTDRSPEGGFDTSDTKPILAGLKRFADVSQLLGLSDPPLEATPCFETVALLFDQDQLVHRLANAEVPAKEDIEQAHAFVLNITKAELWMLGYDNVAPKGYTAAATRTARRRGFKLRARGPLYEALHQFWRDQKGETDAVRKARFHLTHYFPLFFAKLDANPVGESTAAEPDSEAIYNELQNRARQGEKTLIQDIWDHIYSIGSRIWDGIKRAWRWFTTMVKKVQSSVTIFVRNVSRLAYDCMLKSFEAAKAIIEGVTGTLSFFGDRRLPLPKRGLGIDPRKDRTVILRDFDFDFTALVDSDAPPAETRKLTDYVNGKSSLFVVSCRFLASLLDLTITMIGGLFTGWAMLLMALLKFYKSIQDWAPVFLEAAKAERDILARETADA